MNLPNRVNLRRVCPFAFAALFVFPASSNYRLQEWAMGGAGSDKSQSPNYQTNLLLDPVSGSNQAQSDAYQLNPGLLFVHMADVAPAPTVTNDSQWYNKLKLVINPGPNPSDATFAVAVSTDGFVTTQYIQSDNTLGNTLGAEDWRTYTDWNTTTGIMVIGLQSNTTYAFKVKSEQGSFTEAPWGPSTSVATSPPVLTFDIDIAATDQETDPPFGISLGTLSAGSVTTATDKIWLDLGTNAEGGGVVFVAGDNAGLKSPTTNHTIAAVSANLAGTSEGYGLQVDSNSQTSGGPMAAEAPFNGSGDIVGQASTTLSPILSSSIAPVFGGRSSVNVKTIINASTPAGTDYTETVTLVAAATF